MKITESFEPIRSIYAPGDVAPHAKRDVLSPLWMVDYGLSEWPSRSYWIVPGTIDVTSKWI